MSFVSEPDMSEVSLFAVITTWRLPRTVLLPIPILLLSLISIEHNHDAPPHLLKASSSQSLDLTSSKLGLMDMHPRRLPST
jgi:hypothetical protein